ncbi:DUF6681 family protein [Periweissella beninensis]|uniref:DUF6681 family protein n=1 Tax=Periweissella beninensis TaxID=504936 RepID=UPI0021A4E406|nr:DUF6681 family protein [Periweissella beninensis]MCT4396740.1 hypothetical protein [Periweissella beninensis]
MLITILEMVNHYFGFFNVNTKFKGRLYTILGFIGSWYILYIAISFLTAARYLRGIALLLAFLGLMYVIYLNFMYYFTSKKPILDISPRIEKMIGGGQTNTTQLTTQPTFIIPNQGFYDQKQVLPTAVKSNNDEQKNIEELVTQLEGLGVYNEKNAYQGFNDEQIKNKLLVNDNHPVYANVTGFNVPYVKLHHEGTHVIIYGGLNEMQAIRLGEIIRIGLADTTSALEKFDIFLANVNIVGGQGKTLARSGFVEKEYPYTLKAEIAYTLKK